MQTLKKMGRALASLLSRAESSRALADQANLMTRAAGNFEPLGPGSPLEPHLARGSEPRRWIYPPGINIAQAPRALPGLTSFQQLRNFAASYDVLRICLETRKQQLRGLKWDVVVRHPQRSVGSDFTARHRQRGRFFLPS